MRLLDQLPERIYLNYDAFHQKSFGLAFDDGTTVNGIDYTPYPYIRADLVNADNVINPDFDIELKHGQCRWALIGGVWIMCKVVCDCDHIYMIDFDGNEIEFDHCIISCAINPPVEIHKDQ